MTFNGNDAIIDYLYKKTPIDIFPEPMEFIKTKIIVISFSSLLVQITTF